jgi:hypothetical protein
MTQQVRKRRTFTPREEYLGSELVSATATLCSRTATVDLLLGTLMQRACYSSVT